MDEEIPQLNSLFGKLDFPLNVNDQKIIEKTPFEKLNALIFKGGLPILNAVPTYKGIQGEIVLVDDGSSTRQICAYENGTWRCATLGSSAGFASKVRAHTTLQLQIPVGNSEKPLDFDIKDFDVNSEFDCPAQRTGIARAGSGSGHLIDNVANQFVPADVGRWVYNSTDYTYTQITAYNSASDVSVNYWSGSNKGYRIFGTKFTAKDAGYYQVNFRASLDQIQANGFVRGVINKNGSGIAQPTAYVSSAGANVYSGCPAVEFFDVVYLAVGDYLEFLLAQDSSGTHYTNNIDTYFSIHRLS